MMTCSHNELITAFFIKYFSPFGIKLYTRILDSSKTQLILLDKQSVYRREM